jgi:serine/threonine protein kinase
MPGGDLIEYLKKKCELLPEGCTKKIIKQVATGIKALHDRNIIHRDIKLNNILMNSNGENPEAFIGDFGSSTKLKSSFDTSQFGIGTPGYIAPEILLG